METGILYVVFNKWICNPETNEMPYKIGITKNSVKERYYGLDLKMPGQFETLFAYKLDDYTRAENTIHNILQKYHVNGEWFIINQDIIEHIKKSCEIMGGELVTEELESVDTEIIPGNAEIDSKIYEDSININGINVPLYKNKYETTQDFIKNTLRLLSSNNLVPEFEIKNMLNKNYCNEVFDISFPIIQDDNGKLKDDKGHSRYWSKKLFGNYYVCSQWWKGKEEIYKEKISKWIKKIGKYSELT